MMGRGAADREAASNGSSAAGGSCSSTSIPPRPGVPWPMPPAARRSRPPRPATYSPGRTRPGMAAMAGVDHVVCLFRQRKVQADYQRLSRATPGQGFHAASAQGLVVTIGLVGIEKATSIPSPLARKAIAVPIRPKPTIPSTRPRRPAPRERRPCTTSLSRCRGAGSWPRGCRVSAKASARAESATSSLP